MLARLRILASILLLASAPSQAAGIAEVPPGNRHAEQPEIPFGSGSRTRAMRTTYEAKYARVHRLLETDTELRAKIAATAEDYGIDPIHIVGAIVGEHTYNVDVYDRMQTYYVKAVSYLGSSLTFSHGGETVDDFISRPQFGACVPEAGSHEVWSCREAVWDLHFRGRTINDVAYPDDRFGAVFFQPLYAGQTFGLGQLNPLTALKATDLVHRVSGLDRLDHRAANEVYRTIMDPDRTLAYVAATLRISIDAYRDIAGFDISNNPGITATLYNVGNPRQRARTLRQENAARHRSGDAPRLPEENYYGWLVNDRLAEFEALF